MRAPAVLCLFLAIGTANAFSSSKIPWENEDFMLECPGVGNPIYWLLHGKGKAYQPTVSSTEKITVYENGTIAFKMIEISHAGTHICVRENDGELTAYPVELRVLATQTYQYKFYTGLLAAIVCFAIFALSCLVYHKRWRPVKEGVEDRAVIVSAGYDNPTLTQEDECSSTKM